MNNKKPMTKNDFIKKLQMLKSIKADKRLRLLLYEKVKQAAGDEILAPEKVSAIEFFLKKPIFVPVLLLIVLIGSGVGIVSAAQSSLPTNTLYPVKIASEKAHLALTFNNVKKAELHSRWSSRRLKEIKKLAERKEINEQITREAIGNYRAELRANRAILGLLAKATSSVAQKIAAASIENRDRILKLTAELSDANSLKILNDALRETEGEILFLTN